MSNLSKVLLRILSILCFCALASLPLITAYLIGNGPSWMFPMTPVLEAGVRVMRPNEGFLVFSMFILGMMFLTAGVFTFLITTVDDDMYR